MRRRLFTFVSAISLVLCLATAVLWVRSRRAMDAVYRATPHSYTEVCIGPGGKLLVSYAEGLRHTPGWAYLSFERGEMPRAITFWGSTRWTWGGIRVGRTSMRGGQVRAVSIHVPLAYPTALFACLPLAWCVAAVRRLKRAELAKRGYCIACGYDLRATPNRCPECGAIPGPAKS